jgi:hypothetical protein
MAAKLPALRYGLSALRSGSAINVPHDDVQLGYLEVTVQEMLRSGWPGPFVKVEGWFD